MRIPRTSADAAILCAALLPGLAIASGSYDCGRIVVNENTWDLSKLGGPKSVLQSEKRSSSFKNTTYTIDICKPLEKENSKIKCPNFSRVCAVEREILKDGEGDMPVDSWPVAGALGGKDLDAKWESLSQSDSEADSVEGLRLTMYGGYHEINDEKRAQRVIVKFICDKTRVGDENLWNPEDKYRDGREKRAEGDDADKPKDGGKDSEKDGETEDDASKPSLRFISYDTFGKEMDTLHLEWKTRYACENAKDEKDRQQNNHWGFFTWFIIVAFLSTASYLIFGSWLNYNRYGARGWDLLPHGDTIRDIPYLLKDWMRRVLSTIQGGGTRGGYAAV